VNIDTEIYFEEVNQFYNEINFFAPKRLNHALKTSIVFVQNTVEGGEDG
jgi:hypothetical protein